MTQWAKWAEAAAVTGTFILAAWMRLGWTGVVPFGQDEANLSLSGLDMVRNGHLLPLGAFTSAGMPHFPAGSWLYALPFIFTSDPLFAALCTAILSLVAIAALWWMIRNHVGKFPALTAALFLAAQPYAVIFSRSIWQPNPLSPITTFWLISAFFAITGKRRIAFMTGLTVFLGGLLPQIHLAGFGILAATGVIFVRWRWWQRWKVVLAGGLLAAALTLPYFIYVACCGPEVADMVKDYLNTPSVIDGESTIHTFEVITGTNWQRFLAREMVPPLPVENMMAAVVVLLVMFGLWRFGQDVWQKTAVSSRRVLAELAIISIVCMPLVFLRHGTPARAYYLLPVLPGAAILVGLSTLAIGKWGRFLVVSVGILALIWSADVNGHLQVIESQAVPGGISAPLNILRDVAYHFPPSTPVTYFTHGDTSMYTAQSLTFATFWWDYPQNRVLNGTNLLILPAYPGVLLVELEALQAWEELQSAGLTNHTGRIPRRQGEDDFVYVCYDGHTLPAGFKGIKPVAFEHGVTLAGWKARYVGARLRISTLWQVGENFMPTDDKTLYQQFTHLYTELTPDTPPVLISDVALSLHTWQSGDTVIVMADFYPQTQGIYYLSVGQYRLADGQRMKRIDGDGDSVLAGSLNTAELPQPSENLSSSSTEISDLTCDLP